MSLIEDIQNAAVDSNSDLATLLRKCKLLAAQLGSQPLEDWLLWESNGYPDEVEVPDYRIWRLEVKGQLFDPFGKEFNNVPIPLRLLPEKARDRYRNYKCVQSIASIEETLRTSEEGTLEVTTGDLAFTLGKTVFLGQYRIIRTWAEFGIGHLIELRNAVRNRILDFAITVWKEAPTAGEQPGVSDKKIKSSRVTQIFNTTVYGGAANLVGSATESQITLGTAINSPIQQGGAHANMIQTVNYSHENLDDLRRLGEVFDSHLDDLNLDAAGKRKAMAQVDTIKAQLEDDPDPLIVKQAGRTLRNITEGAIGSLIATAAQPTVWATAAAILSKLFGGP